MPVVSRKDSDGRASASADISGRMALVSPTLAAWNQASRPAGLRDARLAEPLVAPLRLLLAAPLAQAEQQGRDRARQSW